VAKSFVSRGGQASREDRDIAYWSAVEWGDLLSERENSREVSQLYAEAAERYGDALKINQSGYEVLYNWGTMLSDRADSSSGAEAKKQYAAEREKYEAALAIRRDDLDTIKALGDVLFELAQLSEGEEAAQLRDSAAVRYDAALKIAPSDGAVWNEWGNRLFEQAKKADDEKDGPAVWRGGGKISKRDEGQIRR
jgi:Tfp pilus assembly protein PilF